MSTRKQKGFVLRRFDQKTMSATQVQWRKQFEKQPEEFYPSEYRRILGWASSHMVYDGDAENFAYGIFKDGAQYASAIVDISYTKRGTKWLKLLDLHLAPELDLSFFDENVQTKDLTELAWVFVAAIVGTVDLTQEHPSKVAKLYGRSSTMLGFLRGLAPMLQDQNPGLNVQLDGRWLVIKAR